MRPRDAKRAIERLLHEARHFGVVGQREPGIDVGLERKLRSSDRQNASIVEMAMSLSRSRRSRHRRASSWDSRLASFSRSTMRWRISAAALRVNVIARMLSGIDAGEQQVDVALDQHPRLAGAGRRFEHDVLRRIDGGAACGGVGQCRCGCRGRG